MGTRPRENAALVRRFPSDVVAGGREGVTESGWEVVASGDVNVDVAEVAPEDETVLVRGWMSGRHEESMIDLAPTGAGFEIVYVWFCRVAVDQIVELWSFPDGLGLLGKLSVVDKPSRNRTVNERK